LDIPIFHDFPRNSSIVIGIMLSVIAVTLGLIAAASAESIQITPHDTYSSTIGVPGCHVDTNRIAYFPKKPDCNNLCFEVSANGRKVNLLHIDVSGAAYDISYDAYNYLITGESCTKNPIDGGKIDAEYKVVPMSNCADLIKTPDGKLPIIALNPTYFTVDCPSSSWVGQNTALYNFPNMVCSAGFNEVCNYDAAVSTQPSCPHTLGSQNPLSGLPVYDLKFPTGKKELRLQ
jgi:hypothetical protein